MPVQQIKVQINDHVEVFHLKGELLLSRVAAIETIVNLRDAAARFLKKVQESKNSMLPSVPLSPDLSLVRASIEFSDEPPTGRGEGETFIAELTWLD
jgi:hypothetical protein